MVFFKLRKSVIFNVLLLALFLLAQIGLAVPGHAAAVEQAATAAAPALYKDVNSTDPNFLFIKYLSSLGLLKGFPDGSFRPAAGLTRAEAAALLAKAGDLKPAAGKSVFKDVSAKHWAAASITAVKNAGLLAGYPDGTFRPERALTRAEGITLLLKLSKQDNPGVELPALADITPQHWAASSVAIGLASEMVGLSSDNKHFLPDTPLSRASLARALAVLLTRDPALYVTSLTDTLKVTAGTVTVTRSGSSTPETVEGTTKLNAGDTVQTGTTGQADIIFPDGTGLRLEKDSQFTLKEARGRSYIKSDGTPGTAVEWLAAELKHGKMFGALAASAGSSTVANTGQTAGLKARAMSLGSLSEDKIRAAAAVSNPLPWWKQSGVKRTKVKIDMPTGVAAIRGTFWENTVRPDGSFTTSLLTGEAEVTAGGQTVNLTGEQRTEVAQAGTPPAKPAALTVDDKKQWVAQKDWAKERAQEIQAQKPQELTPPPPADKPQQPAQPTLPTLPTVPVDEQPKTPAISDTISLIDQALTSVENSTSDNVTQPTASDDSSGDGTIDSGTTDSGTGGTTPPSAAVSTSPADGAAGVSVSQSILVNFGQDVAPGASFSGITITNTGDSTVAEYTYDLTGSTLTLTPAPSLAPGAAYTVTLPAGAVKDTAGNDLAAVSFDFTTGVAYTVRGTVYSPEGYALDTSVLSSVQVELKPNIGYLAQSPWAYVNPDGTFSFSDVPEGDYQLKATVSPSTPYTISYPQNVHLTTGSSAEIAVRMTYPSVHGVVYSPNDTPITGLSLNATLTPLNLPGRTQSVSVNYNDGTYKFGGVPSGYYVIQASSYSSSSTYTDSLPTVLYIDEETPLTKNINLTNPTITGALVDPDGNLITQGYSYVYLGVYGNGSYKSVSVKPDGTFKTGGLPSGKYNLWVPPYYTAASAVYAPPLPITIDYDGTSQNVEIPFIENTPSVQGTVYTPGAARQPFSPSETVQAEVELKLVNSDTYLHWSVPVAADGTYELKGIPTGTYELWASLDGVSPYKNSYHQTVNITQGQVRLQDITLSQVLVTGQILKPDGQPFIPSASSDVQVSLHSHSSTQYYSAYDYVGTDGTFHLGGVPDGDYWLLVYLDEEDNPYAEPEEVPVSVTQSTQQNVDITLALPVLSGRVKAPDTKISSYTHVNVNLRTDDTHEYYVASAEALRGGYYKIGPVANGTYKLKTDVYNGPFIEAVPVTVQMDGTSKVQDIALTNPQISGAVVLAGDLPVMNTKVSYVEVVLRDDAGTEVARTRSNKQSEYNYASFKFGNLPAGNYTLQAVMFENGILSKESALTAVNVTTDGPMAIEKLELASIAR